MTLDDYRREVINSVACAYCLAEIGDQCVVMPEPGARTVQVGYAHYVHDDRSFAHLLWKQ